MHWDLTSCKVSTAVTAQSPFKQDSQRPANILNLESNGHLDPLQIPDYGSSLLQFENPDFGENEDPCRRLAPC